MHRAHIRHLIVALFLAVACFPQALVACTACAGRSDDAMARGMNMGIFALLIVIVSVLAGIASFAVFLARRAAQFPAQSATPVDVSEAAPSAESDAEAHSVESISQPTK